MSSNIRSDSGDAFHAWEDVKCSRQEYATFYVQSAQRSFGGTLTFAQLVESLRFAGECWDAWDMDCKRFAEHQRERGAA